MSLCLARQSADPQGKTGFLEVALDPLVNKTGITPVSERRSRNTDYCRSVLL